jgi:hypothetical protein
MIKERRIYLRLKFEMLYSIDPLTTNTIAFIIIFTCFNTTFMVIAPQFCILLFFFFKKKWLWQSYLRIVPLLDSCKRNHSNNNSKMKKRFNLFICISNNTNWLQLVFFNGGWFFTKQQLSWYFWKKAV